MNSLKKSITILAAHAAAAEALDVFDIDQQTSIVLAGDQARLTLDEDGKFKHPFTEQAHAETIHYPDSGTFSVKLKQVELPTE